MEIKEAHRPLIFPVIQGLKVNWFQFREENLTGVNSFFDFACLLDAFF